MNKGISYDDFNGNLGEYFAKMSNLELNKNDKDEIRDIIKRINEDVNLNSYEKGEILENLVLKILLGTKIFKCIANKHTQSNEFDILVNLNHNGKILRASKIIPEWIPDYFLIECKNHVKPVEVGLVGKFYSLMDSSKVTLGIFISKNGISGKSDKHWSDAVAFVNKINLKYSESKNPKILLDLDLEEVGRVLEDDINIVEIIESRKIQIDLDIGGGLIKWITPHENQGTFKTED